MICMPFTFTGQDRGIGYTVDNTDATFSLEVSKVAPNEKQYADTLYPSYAEAINSSEVFNAELLPSIDMIRGKGKQFDDGPYAVSGGLPLSKEIIGTDKDGRVMGFMGSEIRLEIRARMGRLRLGT